MASLFAKIVKGTLATAGTVEIVVGAVATVAVGSAAKLPVHALKEPFQKELPKRLKELWEWAEKDGW